MHNKTLVIQLGTLLMWIGILVNACSSPSSQKAINQKDTTQLDQRDKQRFPNKRSELAILMRNMIDDLKANRENVRNNDSIAIDWVSKYQSILTATPTDENDAGPVFEGFAHKFLNDLEQFQYADSNNKVSVYNALVQSCVDCHQQHCRGPIPAINKLRL